jgi:hypothetical protein
MMNQKEYAEQIENQQSINKPKLTQRMTKNAIKSARKEN